MRRHAQARLRDQAVSARVAKLLAQASELSHVGALRQAREILESARRLDPPNPQIRELLAETERGLEQESRREAIQAALREARLDEARELFADARQMFPEDAKLEELRAKLERARAEMQRVGARASRLAPIRQALDSGDRFSAYQQLLAYLAENAADPEALALHREFHQPVPPAQSLPAGATVIQPLPKLEHLAPPSEAAEPVFRPTPRACSESTRRRRCARRAQHHPVSRPALLATSVSVDRFPSPSAAPRPATCPSRLKAFVPPAPDADSREHRHFVCDLGSPMVFTRAAASGPAPPSR